MQKTKPKAPLGNRREDKKTGGRTKRAKRRAPANGSGPAGGDATTLGGAALHLLNGNLRTLSLFELGTGCGTDQALTDRLAMIDTEQKQLQCIADLQAIVKAQPRYRKMKEPNWKPATEPKQVIAYYLRRLGPVAGGNDWMIDTWRDGRKLRYRFIAYKDYRSDEIKWREEHLPLDFLPFLKDRDLPMHDLIVDIVALVSRFCKIPLWDEDGDYSRGLDELKEYEGEVGDWTIINGTDRNTIYEQQQYIYTKGIAHHYLQLIKQRRRIINAVVVQKALWKYKNKSHRQNALVNWLITGIRLAEKKMDLSAFCLTPNHFTCTHLSAERLYKFVWSTHGNDYLSVKADDIVDNDRKNYGMDTPQMWSAAYPGIAYQPFEVNRSLSEYYYTKAKWRKADFPPLLYSFMSKGVQMLRFTYRDYFYRNMLSDQRTPAEQWMAKYGDGGMTLIEVLDRQDLKVKAKCK